MLDGYKTVNEIAVEWKLKPRSVQIMCADGRIVGASKVGNMWFVPKNVEKPVDARIKSGRYKK